MGTPQKTSSISVTEAITKGREMVLLPRILMVIGLFFFLFPITLILIAIVEGPKFSTTIWWVCAGVGLFCFVVFFCLPFLFWSKRTTRWKLWAFANVDDVNELKISASAANLCPAYGSVMDRLQIQSAEEREQWRNLQHRANFQRGFIDDLNIPPTTAVFYSKLRLTVKIVFASLFVAIGVAITYFAIKHNGQTNLKIVGVAIAVVPLFMIFGYAHRMLRKLPELVLDDRGLYSKQTGSLNWDLIFNEKVTRIDRGRRGVKVTLNFQHPGGIADIDITDFSVGKSHLERLIRVYRGRLS